MKEKVFLMTIALLGVLFLSGCKEPSPFDTEKENNFMEGMKPFKEIYYNCSDWWTYEF